MDFNLIPGDNSNFAQQLALYIADGNMPDVVRLDYSMWKEYAVEGAWADLTDYITDDLTDLNNYVGDYWRYVRQDDRVYGVPSLSAVPSSNVLAIRKDWLDAKGLDIPVTLDEFVNVMRAFTETDGNHTTYGLGGNGTMRLIPLFGAFGASSMDENFLNEDGTIKDAYKNVDFSEIMKNAKASGNTSAYNAAAMARFYKIMGNYGAYGQYDDGNYTVPGLKKTEAARQFDEQIAASDRALNAEAAAANAEAAAKRDIANIEAKSKLDQIKATTQYGAPATGKSSGMTLAQATAAIKNGELSDAALSVYNANHGTSYTKDNPPPIAEDGASWNQPSDGSNTENNDEKLNEVYDKSDDTVKKYIRNCLKPLITENSITEEELKNHLINNSYEYDLEVKDIKNICEALGVDSMWVDGYKNRGLFGWGSGVKEKK